MTENPIISIGFYKGEPDFRVSCQIDDFTVERMNQLRAMIPVAIGVAEDMFRRANERRNPAAQSEPVKVQP